MLNYLLWIIKCNIVVIMKKINISSHKIKEVSIEDNNGIVDVVIYFSLPNVSKNKSTTLPMV